MLQHHIIIQIKRRVRNNGKGEKVYQFLFQIYLSPQLDHECLKDKEHAFTKGMDLSAYRFTQDKLSVLSISH